MSEHHSWRENYFIPCNFYTYACMDTYVCMHTQYCKICIKCLRVTYINSVIHLMNQNFIMTIRYSWMVMYFWFHRSVQYRDTLSLVTTQHHNPDNLSFPLSDTFSMPFTVSFCNFLWVFGELNIKMAPSPFLTVIHDYYATSHKTL